MQIFYTFYPIKLRMHINMTKLWLNWININKPTKWISIKFPYSNSILKWALFNVSGSQWEGMRRPVMPAQQDMLASCLTDISSSLHVDRRLRRASVNLLIPLFWLGPNCGCFRVHLLYIHILCKFIFVLF